MNTGQDAGPDGHREAQGENIYTGRAELEARYERRIADLTAERDEARGIATSFEQRIFELLAERDAARADSAALVEACIAPDVGDGVSQCRLCSGEGRNGKVLHRRDCPLATHGAAGQRMLERMAALERVRDVVTANRGQFGIYSDAAHHRLLTAVDEVPS